jgi:hypothetical protein
MDKAIEILARRVAAVERELAEVNHRIFLANKKGEETIHFETLHRDLSCARLALAQAHRELELAA